MIVLTINEFRELIKSGPVIFSSLTKKHEYSFTEKVAMAITKNTIMLLNVKSFANKLLEISFTCFKHVPHSSNCLNVINR